VAADLCDADVPQCSTCGWYFIRQEIEDYSPSRKDGIDLEMEVLLRESYGSFLRDLGKTLKTVAPVCMFLACKFEESPWSLRTSIVEAYKLMYRWDPCAEGRINKRKMYDKKKALLLSGEKHFLETIACDLKVEHPYKPLIAALRRLGNHIYRTCATGNFINDWVRTTLCLEYKPHYIAASSLFLASKLLKSKQPTKNGKVWCLAFDVASKKLEDVIRQILGFLEKTETQHQPFIDWKTGKTTHSDEKPMRESPESCILSGTGVDAVGHSASVTPECKNLASGNCIDTDKEPLQCQTSQCRSETNVLDAVAGEVQPATEKSHQNFSICAGLVR
ncbi:LOW QUALITY PROTEIN: hypothetical protein RJ641_032370, partial [Dillenia turbinata]